MKKPYRTQAVRDLHWALTSPLLMSGECVVDPSLRQSQAAKYQGILREFDRRGSALDRAHAEVRSTSLGTYFEALVATWIDEIPTTRLAATNWQVYGGGGRTVGEFDLLFERGRQPWHWELAVKFYLGHPAEDGQFRWHDPNCRDRLDRKWAKMRGQQLRLAEHGAARRALETLGFDRDPISRALIAGYLFVPLESKFDVTFGPDINRRAPRGWWCWRSGLSQYRDNLDPRGERRWMTVAKPRWLSPVRASDEDRLFEFDEFCDRLSSRNAVMVAGLERDEFGWVEDTRGFVVHDDWPY